MSSSIFDIPEDLLTQEGTVLRSMLSLSGVDMLCHRSGRWELIQADRGRDRPRNEVMRHYVALNRDDERGGWNIHLFKVDQRGGGELVAEAVVGFNKAAHCALRAYTQEDALARLGAGG